MARGAIDLKEGRQFQITLGLPLVAYTVRSGYANTRPDNLVGVDLTQSNFALATKAGQWSWINQFNYATLSVQYVKDLQKSLTVRWTYNLARVGYNYPELSNRMVLWNNEVTLGLCYWINRAEKNRDETK